MFTSFPAPVSAAAGTDFDKLQQEWQDATAKLVGQELDLRDELRVAAGIVPLGFE